MSYITITDIRNEGLPEPNFPDAKVQTYIDLWQEFIDRATRQWFDSRALTLNVDGTDSDTIHTGVPIISVDHIKVNDSQTVLDSSFYRVYNSRLYPDDRKNPRIKLISSQEHNIYMSQYTSRRLKFRKGRQNQEIQGTFGYTEQDGSVPKLIKRALTKLVIEKLMKPAYIASTSTAPPGSLASLFGIITEEETDNHRREYQPAGGGIDKRAPGLTGITDDQEIHNIIALYKAPIGIATPANASLE